MQTRISSKGQITLPSDARRQLKIGAGDVLQVRVIGENSLVLEVQGKPAVKGRADEDIIAATAGLWKDRRDIRDHFIAELRESDSQRLGRLLDD
ncbi:MAG: AbrB/MazE/SpoVT family DNA-binding domain-containing protein [Ignavibacteriales bacterium]